MPKSFAEVMSYDEAKRRPVATRDTVECGGKLLALYVGIHDVRACQEGLKTPRLRGVSEIADIRELIRECRFYPQKRTCSAPALMSAKCQ
jgi:hypothetical protein